jgi:hypothetical protein
MFNASRPNRRGGWEESKLGNPLFTREFLGQAASSFSVRLLAAIKWLPLFGHFLSKSRNVT